MNCSFCGEDFDQEASKKACTACSLVGSGCRKVRCPRCGYEMPEEPALVQMLRNWRKSRAEKSARQLG